MNRSYISDLFASALSAHVTAPRSRKSMRRRPPVLRLISLLLAFSCLWSFAGAGIALAASPTPLSAKSQKPMSYWTLRAMLRSAPPQMVTHSFAPPVVPTPAADVPSIVAVRQEPSRSMTLLDEVGQLSHPVSAAEATAWKRELKMASPVPSRAATLHLWLGEWELAANQQPERARWHFRVAQAQTKKTDPLFGLAAYDAAIALSYAGAYQAAAQEFRVLDKAQVAAHSYSHLRCAYWLRHVTACVDYHQAHSDLGIPEPPRLDPLCGAAALAACRRALSASYDKPAILAACRVTGEGSSLQDVLDAARKLGMAAEAVTADDTGLQMLPKPLVAYVERDHFIAVVKADQGGVSYLCSDCGAWPGGQVNLTWKQWHTMNAGLYGVVTPAGSLWSKRLALLPTDSSPLPKTQRFQIASAGRLTSLPLFRADFLMSLLRKHVVRYANPIAIIVCGSTPAPVACPPDSNPPTDGPGDPGSGPSCGDPVNLATGEEQYGPKPDLTVYNPTGPSVVWQRSYRSLRGPGRNYPDTPGYYETVSDLTYQSDDFGVGWTQSYNIGVLDPIHAYTAGNRSVLFADGSKVVFIAPSTGPTVPTAGSPVLYSAQRPGFPMILQWNYDSTSTYGHFELIMKDRTHWITGSLRSAVGLVSPVTQIKDRNGNSIYLNYASTSTSTASYGFPLLSSITTGAAGSGTALLTVQRATGSSGSIVSVSDPYGRSVYYHNSLLSSANIYPGYPQTYQEVDRVSQIVPTGAVSPPDQWVYGYSAVFNGEYNGSLQEKVNLLHSISIPSPTGTGMSTSYLWYSSDNTSGNPNYGTPSASVPFVSALVDANGNQRLYTSVNASGVPTYPSSYTRISVRNGSSTVYSYTVSYDTNMNEATRTDGAGNVVETTVYNPVKTYRAATITDGNGKATGYTWDNFGNLIQTTPPTSGVRVTATTINTFTYSNFVLGELTQTQSGQNLSAPKQPTFFTYFEPSGLLSTLNAPQPGAVGGTQSVQSSFTYDSLGNVLTVTRPGNNATSVNTTTFNYTTDGIYTQPAAIGQPLTVSNNLNEVTHLRYDAQGNSVSVIDALGNETDMTYDIRNEMLSTALPTTGQTGSGHAGSRMAYLYQMPAGMATAQWPVQTLQYGPPYYATQYDEGNVGAIRQIVHSYGLEGELRNVTGSTEWVSYTYDALYRLSTLRDATGFPTSYFYNAAGYLYQTVYPGAQNSPPTAPLTAGHADTLTLGSYDLDGNVTSRTDGNNVTTTYSYNDPENLLKVIAYPTGTIANVSYAYDGYGRRSAMTDGTGGQTYAYDDDDNLTLKNVSHTGIVGQSLQYQFWPDGSRKQMTTSQGSFLYSYDAVGRMTNLVNPSAEASSWVYQANGWLSTQTQANGSSTVYTRDPQGRVTDLRNKLGTTTLSDFAVPPQGGYDGIGNHLAVNVTIPAVPALSGTTTYAYDYGQTAYPQVNRSQLTGETSTRGGGYTNSNSFDNGSGSGPGNPTALEGQIGGFNSNSQNVYNYFAWDGNGNRSYQPSVGATNQYDPENRMTSYWGGNFTAGYDGDGQQAWIQWPGGQRITFTYDGDQAVLVQYTDGSVIGVASFGANGLLSSRNPNNGVSSFYTFDLSGNTCQSLTATGTPNYTHLVSAFGFSRSSGQDLYDGMGAQFGYRDENTGFLYLLGHRFYDAQFGQFMTRDPMGYGGGVNLYGYCTNDPVNECDPDGRHGVGLYSCVNRFVRVTTCLGVNVGYCVETCTLTRVIFGRPSRTLTFYDVEEPPTGCSQPILPIALPS